MEIKFECLQRICPSHKGTLCGILICYDCNEGNCPLNAKSNEGAVTVKKMKEVGSPSGEIINFTREEVILPLEELAKMFAKKEG